MEDRRQFYRTASYVPLDDVPVWTPVAGPTHFVNYSNSLSDNLKANIAINCVFFFILIQIVLKGIFSLFKINACEQFHFFQPLAFLAYVTNLYKKSRLKTIFELEKNSSTAQDSILEVCTIDNRPHYGIICI